MVPMKAAFICLVIALIGITTVAATNCSLAPHLPCTMNNMQGDCPLDARVPQGWPSKPTKFKVILKDPETPDGGYLVCSSWRMPDDSSFSSVKGFELQFSGADPDTIGIRDCVLVDLSRALWQEQDLLEKYSFEYCRADLLGTYYVILVSLPKPAESHSVDEELQCSQSIYVPSRVSGVGPANWIANITKTLRPCEGRSIDIAFSLAPTQFRFDSYEVNLMKKDHDLESSVERQIIQIFPGNTVPNRTVTFTNVPDGHYFLAVQPVQTQSDRCSRCGCEEQLNLAYCKCKDYCIRTITYDFLFNSTESCKQASLLPSNGPVLPEVAKLVLIALSAVAALVLIVILVLRCRSRNRTSIGERLVGEPVSISDNEEDESGTISIFSRRTALLIAGRQQHDVTSQQTVSVATYPQNRDYSAV